MSADTSRQPRTVGAYELVEKIAEGGMGAVYKARHQTTGRVVAIKIIPADTARNPLLLKRFEQEFRAAEMIEHPNVVKALDYCGAPPTPFLVMEFVDGESLGQRVARAGRLPERDAVRLISQVCEGLHRAHKQGLIHRDVKPDNILVTWDTDTAKLTDLGLVKDMEAETNLTRTGRGLGTPHYMAPEQFRNAKNANVRCDVYSLAATLYTLVTGATPFDNTMPLDCWVRKTKNDLPTPRHLAPELSERVDWAIRRAMSAEPSDRPASCREFMEDLTGTGWRAVPGSGAYVQAAGGSTAAPAVTTMLAPPNGDVWYLVYKDAAGKPRTVKGSTESIRKNLAAGSLGDAGAVLVSRTKTGQFQLLRNVPEFRDLALSAGPGGRLQSTVFPFPATPLRTAPQARTPIRVPDTDRLNAADGPVVPRTDTYAVEPVLSADDTLDPAPRPSEQVPPHRPVDWTPWAILAVVLLAAAVGLLFVLWL